MTIWTAPPAARETLAPDAVYGALLSEGYDRSWYGIVGDEEIAYYREWIGDGIALEVGSGTGRLSAPLLDAGARLHGIEYSPFMLAKLRARIEPRHHENFRQWDARVRPFPIGSACLDTVIIPFSTFAVLHNAPHPILDNRILHEVFRMLRPGGRLVLNDLRVQRPKPATVPAPDVATHAVIHPVHGVLEETWTSRYYSLATPTIDFQIMRRREIRYRSTETGAEVHRCSDHTPVWYPEDFPRLAQAAAFRYVGDAPCAFHQYASVNYLLERPA